MTSSLKAFCVMKQGRFQWSNWSQRIATVDTETGCIWISKKNREDMPYYHKLVILDLQPWLVYKAKYIDEDVKTKAAMLSVRLKAAEVAASPDEKHEVQRRLLDGTANAHTPPPASSFAFASPANAAPASARTGSPPPAAAAPPVKGETVDCVLRFTSAESLWDFTSTVASVMLRRGDTAQAAQIVSARDRAVAAVKQLALKSDDRHNFTDLM